MSEKDDNNNNNAAATIDTDEIIPISRFPALSVFDQTTTYPALIVPVRRTAELRNALKGALLHLPKIKCIFANPKDDTTRKLVLQGDDAVQDERVQQLLQGEDCTLGSHTITLSYNDLAVEEVLRKILPASISELPSAFEIVGSIAHLNLREDVLPYKYWIGKVILDKNQPRIQTVVNKLGSIANEYRTFGMEVIAGLHEEGWSLVKVKEEGCEFTLDFQHVYWNSRLGGEHKRLVQMIQQDAANRQRDDGPTIVADLMAGVGPFAVPLTAACPAAKGSYNHNNKQNKKKKKGKQKNGDKKSENKDDQADINTNNNENKPTIIVHANDLNPASYKYLKINGDKNKCPKDRLFCYNQDARAFCHQLQHAKVEFHHVIMNLPATAPEFLDAFRGFTNVILPQIHVYCFAPKPADSDCKDGMAAVEEQVIQRCSTALGCPVPKNETTTVRIVRDVSPKKNMVCVSFPLPEAVRQLPRISIVAKKEGVATEEEEEDSGACEEPKTKHRKTTK